MYYIKFRMKNRLFNIAEYLFYLSFGSLILIYLFPGSLIGYFLYGNFDKQPNIVNNPIGTSINHFFYFVYLSILAIICNIKKRQIYSNLYFIFFISIFLELSHLVIPNRSFEYFDLFANIFGVGIVFLINKILNV